MDLKRLSLFSTCIATPVVAVLLTVWLPWSPAWNACAGVLVSLLILVPALLACKKHAARIFCEHVLNVMPYPISVKDSRSRLLLFNDAFLEYKQSTREALLNTHGHLERETPEHKMERIREDALVLAGVPLWKEEHIPVHPGTGKEVFQVITKGRCMGLHGETLLVVSQFDTTELNQSRRQLEAESERLVKQRESIAAYVQRLIDVIPQPVYIKDRDSRYVMVNEAFCTQRMLRADELIGKTPLELSRSPEKAKIVTDEDQQVLDGLQVDKEEETTHPMTGEPLFRWIAKRRCTDAEGNPLIVGANFDLTSWRLAERGVKQALLREQALRERTQAFTQRLIDVIPQPVYVKDAESRYMMVNKALLEDMHREPDAMLGKNPLDLGAKPEYADMVMVEDQRIAQGDVIYKEEHILHPYTGNEAFRIISKRSCLDVDGKPVIVGTNFDITPLRQAERAAARASEAKSIFLATMSHEIRTPLNGVIGMLRMAIKRELDDTTHEQIGIGLRSAESLLTIINDILDFSKIEAGQLRLEEIDFDLRQTVGDALQIFRVSAQERSIQLRVEIAEDVGAYFRGDPTRLRQILINLTGNALKFTPRGSVTVRITSAGRGFVGEVIDTGIGIPAEALPNMFQRFQQADSSTTRKFGGTGLGLAICKQLVDAMGGNISVNSTVGVGTTFRFELPLAAGEAPLAEEVFSSATTIRSLNLLCVDDSATNRLIIQSLLESNGHEVRLACDGLEALHLLAREDFDAVFMDGRMPELDGLAATRAIRAGRYEQLHIRNPAVPIVALTANVSTEDVAEFRQAGANEFLAKPIEERELIHILQRIASAHTTQDTSSADGTERRIPMSERLKALLIRSLPGRMDEIGKALDSSDFDALALLFHGLKGNVSYGGDPALMALAAQLESAALAHDRETILTVWPSLHHGLIQLCVPQTA